MTIRLALAVTAALLMPINAAAQPSGNDYYQARASQEASELLNTVERYHLQPGISKMQSRLYGAAWGDFNFILNYFPNHPRALLLMSELCEKWRNPKCNMELYFGNAIQRSPENAGIYLTNGIYLQRRGKLNEAIDSYKKSLELKPDSANTHYNLGLAYVAQKRYALANEHAQQAYALGVGLPGLRNKLVAAGAWKAIDAQPAEDAPKPDVAKSENTGQ